MADKYIKKLADVLCGLIFDKRDRDPEAYDTTATVRRIEDGKAYVHIPGGVDETPVDLTIDAAAGDTVQVRVSGGRAWLVGNRTAPPTDDTTARVAHGMAAKAEVRAEQAEETANSVNGIANSALAQAAAAKQIADDTEQHFWFTETGTDTGAHITEVTQEEWSDPSDPNYQSGGNLLARSNGIAVREGMKELATMSQDGFDAKSYDSSDNEVVIAHLGYGAGTDSVGDTSRAPYYTLGVRKTTITAYSPYTTYNIGDMCVYDEKIYVCKRKITTPEAWNISHWQYYIGNYSTAEGNQTTASGYNSHAEGYGTKAIGANAHAEGDSSIASDIRAHAEGSGTEASGRNSHAEGVATTASNSDSHAEGGYTEASGVRSHAEGYMTTASGNYSHSQNYHTEAGYDYQTVIGEYNDNKSADLFEVGNGTGENARSNAFEVSDTGDITATGKATLGAINGTALFDYTTVSMTSSSISANASGEVTSSASTNSKYYPIAITNVNISTGQASLRRFYFSTQEGGKAVVKIGLQNDGTSAKTISVSADILWVKIAV